MKLRITIEVIPQIYHGDFKVKLMERDMFLDDLLEQRVVELGSRGLGYLRNREPQENYQFEFFVSTDGLMELDAEIQIDILGSKDEILAQSAVKVIDCLTAGLSNEESISLNFGSVTI